MSSICKIISNFYKYKRKLPNKRWFSTEIEKNSKLKVLFFGTDNFSLPSLQVLHKNESDAGSLGVVTSFKKPVNCVRQYALQKKLPILKWPITSDDCRPYDLGVVVSFGHLIPANIINAFPRGMINVHASLLPRWRGAAPIIYAIMNRDEHTGVSIMRIEPKHFDIGNILAQTSVVIKPDAFMPELHNELSEKGADLLLKVIKGYPQTFKNSLKQDNSKATYAPKITSAITDIDWSLISADEIYSRYRALYSFKQLTTQFHSKSLQLLDIRLAATCPDFLLKHKDSAAGSIVYDRENKCLKVKCAHNSFIDILKVRIEGKRAMNATEFNNGFLKKLAQKENTFQANNKMFSNC